METEQYEPEVVPAVLDKKARVVSSFQQVVKHGATMSWQDSRAAQWETAIRRWHSLILSWDPKLDIVKAVGEGPDFRSQAQIIVDIFYNKSPSTLLKRANSLGRLCNYLAVKQAFFPCSESELHIYMVGERDQNCPPSRLAALLEAISFTRHVLGVDFLEACVKSRRCYGAAHSGPVPSLKQAPPLKVEH